MVWGMNLSLLALTILCAFGRLNLARAAEPEAKPEELPRIPPTPAADAVKTFQVKAGFHMDLVAAEPLVIDPIAMSFDENGRLFVIEMRDYSEHRPERLGRVRVLEDTDGDGHFDKSTVFVDNLAWPTAIICYGGGIFIGATPDILFCKDTNGDGKADVRETVFTGFASRFAPYDIQKLNVQALFNSFTWGLDNRIHGANGGNGGRITSLKHPEIPPLELGNRDFSFDPRTFDFRAESGGGQYGLSFDDTGRKFICSNSSHIRVDMYDERDASLNPAFAPPSPALDIPVDGPAATIYRISPDEPWRVIRTRWRVAGIVTGPVEGGGRPSGYFSGATGMMIYRGDAWPKEFAGDAFVADCGANIVHHKKISQNGIAPIARRPDDEQKIEFVASRDNWFRPVQLANAPDGTLYVIDLYREVIEHPWSLPPGIKKYLDLDSGNDRGRIYRILPDGFKQRPPPNLGRASTEDLVRVLEHANGWHRDTAARLLYEREDKAATPLLEDLALHSKSNLARMHALYALKGQGSLSRTIVLASFRDSDPGVRRHALRLSDEFAADVIFLDSFYRSVPALLKDPDPLVRYQLAFALARFPFPSKAGVLSGLVRRDLADPWMRTAVLMACRGEAGKLFDELVRDRAFVAREQGCSFLGQLATVIGTANSDPEVQVAMSSLGTLPPNQSIALAEKLGEGLRRGGSSLSKIPHKEALRPLTLQAEQTVRDRTADVALRSDAVRLLGETQPEQGISTLGALLEPTEPPRLQATALDALAQWPGPGPAQLWLERWPQLTPSLREKALDLLLRRGERIELLMQGLAAQKLQPADFSAKQIEFLRAHPNPAVRAKAAQLLGVRSNTEREKIVQRFLPALVLKGAAAHGKEIFEQRCTACHRLGNIGQTVAPDLATVVAAGKESVLSNLIDPNRQVAPQYQSYWIATNDGELSEGILGTETATSITLKQPNGQSQVIYRSQIARMQNRGVSLMPEGLEEGLSLQDMADLLEFITSTGNKAP